VSTDASHMIGPLPDQIYMLGYNYSEGDSMELEPDEGFFWTKDAAQAKADELNRWTIRYEEYVRNLEASNAERSRTYHARKHGWQTLEDAGLRPLNFMADPVLNLSEILSQEDWRARQTPAYTVETIHRPDAPNRHAL